MKLPESRGCALLFSVSFQHELSVSFNSIDLLNGMESS